MIRLTRVRTEAAIPEALRDPKRAAALAKLAGSVKGGKAQFDDEVWHAAKAQLKAESKGKCAYCEASTDAVAYGDVEHFRPKARYWWLAYWFDNMVYACQLCNEAFKRDVFPVEGRALAAPALKRGARGLLPDPLCEEAVRAFGEAMARERPRLVHPYELDPEPLLAWRADGVLREVEVLPAKRAGVDRRRAEAVIRFYGLNREELRRRRFCVYRELELLMRAREVGPQGLRREVERELEAMVAADGEFAAMCRYFVRVSPGAPFRQERWRPRRRVDARPSAAGVSRRHRSIS